MAIEKTSPVTPVIPQATSAAPEEIIRASQFTEMITVLENLASHSHVFYDDYTTVCECQCQCACNRGIL